MNREVVCYYLNGKGTLPKIPAGQFSTSYVNWGLQQIQLDTNDTFPRKEAYMKGQIPVVHEFGHAVGNTAVLGRGDEYKSTSIHSSDVNSIMNVGNELRKRHFSTILDELNKMIPGTTFTVHQVRVK